jgi:hypothetical protein
MDEKTYQLADKALSKMLEGEFKGYSKEEFAELIECPADVSNLVTIVLLTRGYAAFPVNEKTQKPIRGDGIYLTEKGADFYLSGGFKEIMRREKLMTDNIEASIRTANAQRKTGKITLTIATITCISIVVQILISISPSNKPVWNKTKPLYNMKAIENTIDTLPRKSAAAAQCN